MSARIKTHTLGCKVNQYETEYVRQGLLGIGFRDAQDGESAELCIINTCTVTGEGDAKSRQLIRRVARDNPDARLIVMGCYATRVPNEVWALPGVTDVVTDKRELPDLLGRFGVVDIPTGISEFGSRHRAYLKVQDGCMLRCSYCVIPLVRPQPTSRPIPEILDEVRRLVDNGYRELVLTGVHLGHYGVDGNWNKPKSQWLRLSHLVDQIAQVPGDFRLRLSSIEATEVTRELIDTIGRHQDKVCPHLHICLQSGSDAMLRKMRRRWSTRMFIDRCQLLRRELDCPALTTDVIVGFPGESDRDFEATCRVVKEVGFSKIHIFPFSPRSGTPAADMPQQITRRVKSERSRRLAEIERQLRDAYFASLVGRRLQVLVESALKNEPTRMVGTSCRYAPVELSAAEARCGELVDCTATGVGDQRLEAVGG
jgi:threonylcarbamoyladenosine tRNA methylthiotransferase MtaB